ncbi:MAG: hypothetical protein EDX89_02515 [Acidobacteria bacterium]|nr:MAG: hypothetical protein EDX89_02515 [Acidobacteriota bacterium]
MRDLFRCLASEAVKLKRTLALANVLLAPAVVAGLQTLLYAERGERLLRPGTSPYEAMGNAFGLWAVLMLPLLVSLQASLLYGVEHASQSSRHLLALPVARPAFFAAKAVVASGLLLLATALLAAFVLAGGSVLVLLRPELGGASLPLGMLARKALLVFLASLPMLALHLWIAGRTSSFTASMGSGVAATVVGFVLLNSDRWAGVYPWTLPAKVLRAGGEGLPAAALLAAAAGLALFAAAAADVSRREAA